MRRTKLTLNQLVETSERKTARIMGLTLKQYRAERDVLMDMMGYKEKKRSIYHQRKK